MAINEIYKNLLNRPTPRLFERNNFFIKKAKRLLISLYHEALEHSQYYPQKELKKIHEKRLKILIDRAKTEVPFYRNYFKGMATPDDFWKLPVISKEKMRHEFDKETIINMYLGRYRINQYTSGSTGIPFHFFIDANMLSRRRAIYRRMLAWAGKCANDTVIALMPKAHPGLETENIFFQCVDPDDIEKKITEIYRLFTGRSIILQTRTSHLLRLAKFLERDKKNFAFKSIISYTEQLLPEAREYIEQIFKAPVFNYYACNELTAIAQECEFHNGLHVNSEWVYLEIIDENNKPIESGQEGYIVLTAFDNEVMPFIRYKMGDIGYWLLDPCPCGRTLPRIHIEGRENNSFLLPDGRIGYFASLMWPIMQQINKIIQYQVTRRSMTNFVIKLRPAPDFVDKDKEFIIKRFHEYLGHNTDVSLEIVKKIELTPGGKELAFINLAP